MALSWNNPSVKLEGEGEKDDEDLNLSDANDPVTVVIDGEEEAEQRRNKDRNPRIGWQRGEHQVDC